MKAFFAAVLATVVLGLGAALVLRVVQRPAYQAFSTTGARVGDPGENLVGQNWNGLNAGQNAVPKQPPHG